jgi:hypothetical protein
MHPHLSSMPPAAAVLRGKWLWRLSVTAARDLLPD